MIFWFFDLSIGKSQQVQGQVLESFEKYLATTDIQLHFEGIAEVPASRTLKQQLRMIHKESGIHVLLLADDMCVAEASKLIRDFVAVKPICKLFSLKVNLTCLNPHHFFNSFSTINLINRSKLNRVHFGVEKRFEQHFNPSRRLRFPVQHIHNIRAGDIFHAGELWRSSGSRRALNSIEFNGHEQSWRIASERLGHFR